MTGKTCPTQGALAVFETLKGEVLARGLRDDIRVNKAGCFDQCGPGPLVVVYPEATWYANVRVEDCLEIVESHLLGNQVVERLRYHKPLPATSTCAGDSSQCQS